VRVNRISTWKKNVDLLKLKQKRLEATEEDPTSVGPMGETLKKGFPTM